MGEFSALIQAILDTSGIPGQIKKIEDTPITLNNITVNQGKLRSEIESALSGSFTINVSPTIGKPGIKNAAKSMINGLSAQMKPVGTAVATSFNSSIAQALKAEGIVDDQIAGAIGDSLSKTLGSTSDVVVKNVKATVKEANSQNAALSRVVVQAEDSAGKLITSTAVISKKGTEVTTTVSEKYAQAASSIRKSNAEIAESINYKIDTGGVQASISKISQQWDKFSNVTHNQKAEMLTHYKDLMRYQNLLTSDAAKNMSADDLVATYQKYSKALQTCQNDMSMLGSAGTKLADAMDISILDSKMSTWMQKNTKAAKKYGDAIKSLQSDLQQYNLTEESRANIAKRFKEIDYEAAAKGLKGSSVWDQIKSAGAKMAGFVTTERIIETAIRGFKEMYQAVYDIDTAMTNLRKVTDESESTYTAFLDRSATSAQELGRTVSGLVEQTAAWSKLGYSLPEAEQLSKLSSIYANVAEVDDATAVSDIVTAMKAFNIETADAITVVDSLNELGKVYCP